MIDTAWCRLMAAYNSEMNRRLYAAAAGLEDAARRADGGAFFGSLHGTLCHLLWADRQWMSRLGGWEKPAVAGRDSAGMIEDFAELRAAREAADAGIEAWAAGLDAARLAGSLSWYSGALGRDQTQPFWVLVTHLFNHQTHHRGQAHALLTRAGQKTGDTDLPFILDLPALGIG